MVLPAKELFSDFRTSFAIHPVTGDLVRNTNNDAIKDSVKNLVLTQFYGRPFKPNVGSNVTAYLFDNFDVITEENVAEAIRETIDNNEPRADLLDVQVSFAEDNNSLTATIVFRAKNDVRPTAVDVLVKRIR